MAIRSILTNYTGSGGGAAALRLAVQMAQKYDAHLTGAVWQPQNPLRRRAGAIFTREIDRILDQAEAEFVEERRAAFTAAVTEAGLLDRSDFRVLSGKGDSITEAARGHDILTMGGAAEGNAAGDFAVRPDVVALRSGRPVVIVPASYQKPAILETALLAWDGKRAAARALADAMHILGTKEKVTVLGIGEGLPSDYAADVLRLMALHGIEAELLIRPASAAGIGPTILDACSETGAGLLIMGAYEHSKFSEDLLGGVTRDILEQAKLPVLMSH
ncbi:universal stress protein [uncultured Paracoccus sp.]|uniref:universal stress protein n=1 Tax=uncultured Paracoccus sp. TaxID=189685 RepID=UPI0026065806|nr:universal stress protein [uncultured Paracoccus sp.]